MSATRPADTRRTIADAFDEARTSKSLDAIHWRAVHYRDETGDPTAQQVVDALYRVVSGFQDLESAKAADALRAENYRKWLEPYKGHNIDTSTLLESKFFRALEREYVAIERGAWNTWGMAQRMLELWASCGEYQVVKEQSK